MEELMLPCLNKQIFGYDCPGCGAQRALSMVFSGEFSAAFHMFPAIYPILFLLFFLIGNLFFKFKGDQLVKIGLIVTSATVIIGSYFYKLSFLIH